MARWKFRGGVIALATALLLLLVLCGCNTAVAVRVEPRLHVVGSGAPAALVFSDPRRADRFEAGPEAGRRDGMMSARPMAARTALDSWPEAERPSPRNYRRIHLDSRPDAYGYFERESERGWSHQVRRPWW